MRIRHFGGWALLVPTAVIVLLLPTVQATGQSHAAPLIGVNYMHWGLTGCDRSNTGILNTYGMAGVRRKVRAQLAAMHAAGLETLRLLLWHQTLGADLRFGIVSSNG